MRNDWKLSYLRTKSGVEIDLIIERPGRPLALIEIKSKNKVSESDAKSLESLGSELDPKSERYLFSLDPNPTSFAGTKARFWVDGLDELLDQNS